MGVAAVDPIKIIDHYDLDDGDATHPIYISYLIPTIPRPLKGLVMATLSWHMEAFRSTTNLTPSSVGTDATASSGHSHNHAHTIPIAGMAHAADMSWAGGGTPLTATLGPGNTSAINADASGESGHSHSHSHSLTGTGVQSVTDGPIATVQGISFDGRDRTGGLGGPWSGDVIELDISSVFPMSAGMWHRLALSLSGLGRVTSLLRIYYTH